MRPEGAIFDLDGTLTDSMYVWDWAPGELIRRLGGDPPPDLAHTIRAMSRQETADYLIRTFHLTQTLEELTELVDELVGEEYRDKVPLKPGARTLLRRLKELGVPCAIATASEACHAQQAMERLGVWDCFSFALSCAQYGPKTRPDLYWEAARRLGSAPERTLVFEDALHAACSAREGGFQVVGVYDPSAREDEQALRSVSHWYLKTLDDPEFLNQLR